MKEQVQVYKYDAITAGQFCAVFATEDDENFGYPFWIGKVVSTEDANDDEASSNDDESDDFPHGLVKIHDYRQQENSKGEPTGKYMPHLAHGAKKANSSATTARKVTNDVGLEQVAYVFDGLTSAKTIPVAAKKEIAFYCEVAKRQKAYDCPGVEKFNNELKLKYMPMDYESAV